MILSRPFRWCMAFAVLSALYSLPVLAPVEARAQDAQDEPPVRVGVVDRQKIMRESMAGQGVRKEFEAQEGRFREEISARENKLREQQEELQRQKTILAPEAYAGREAEFAKKVEQLQRDLAVRNKQLESILSYGMQQIDRASLQIIAEIAESKDYTLVLDKTQLLMVSKTYEFTDDVLATLNERVPSVPTAPSEEPQ